MTCPPTRGKKSPRGCSTHPRSVVFDQAENRLHGQKAILSQLFRKMNGHERPQR